MELLLVECEIWPAHATIFPGISRDSREGLSWDIHIVGVGYHRYLNTCFQEHLRLCQDVPSPCSRIPVAVLRADSRFHDV